MKSGACSGCHLVAALGGVGENHQAVCASKGADGHRHGAERVHNIFQPSAYNKIHISHFAMKLERFCICCEVNFTRQ